MKKRRRTAEQIIRILRASEGMKVEDACREHGMSMQTYYRWKEKYGNIGVKEAQRLKDLEKELGTPEECVTESRSPLSNTMGDFFMPPFVFLIPVFTLVNGCSATT